MKKVLLMVLVLVTTSMVAQAQFALGLKAGVSSSKVDINDLKGSYTQIQEKDAITGYHVGAFTRLKIAGLLFQPEAILSSSGGKVEVTDTGSGTEVQTTEKFKFSRLDVPLLVGFSILNVARIQAGPVASVLMEGKFADQDLKNSLNKADWGYQAGIGFDFGNLTTDLRYENIKRDYTQGNNSFGIGNQQVILSVGFKIIGK